MAHGHGASTRSLVGASLLAMDVNDNAGHQTARVVHAPIVGTPPGASSLLQIRKKRFPCNDESIGHARWPGRRCRA
ncbi:hypothetical protein EKG40_05865 [Pseudomonas moorei]|nr:hypothetical protein EKG40_05865 [Pseudomonas moorei]